MQCPVDGSDLVSERYEGVVDVDRCSTCQGLWLAPGELETIQDTRANDYSAELATIPNTVAKAYAMAHAKLEGTRDCPVCSSELLKVEYARSSQVMVDKCTNGHGLWLDPGELKELEVFFERSRLPTDELRGGFFASLMAIFR